MSTPNAIGRPETRSLDDAAMVNQLGINVSCRVVDYWDWYAEQIPQTIVTEPGEIVKGLMDE